MKQHTTDILRFVCLAMLLAAGPTLFGEERELTAEQREALEKSGDFGEETQAKRPAKLPDLTKGQSVGERVPQNEWHLGPTGIMGYMPGGLKGDQIEVTSVLKGSPAEGKLQWGDVILGVNGEKFVPGQNMGLVFGNAIIESEKEENGGILKLRVWRDSNFLKRNGRKDVAGVDIDTLIDEAEGDVTLYDWKPEEQRKQEVRNDSFDAFPIAGEILEITLELAVLPPYSDTSPYDCPKTQKILEDAWKVLEQQFKSGKVRANRKGTVAALALVASGKPEHRALVREWVRSPQAKGWHPSVADKLDIMKPGGYVSWRMSFDGLDCAIYYHATGDEFVLPALRAYAIYTAKGQAGGGSWGHTFAWPSFNGGQLHGMNPGYGAVNTTGNRCFMLLALAKQLGVEHPEIDAALNRASRFFGSYYEKGAVPYGHHGAWPSDDSNGKNVGVAFAFKMLGDLEKARWFAQMSTHASFTRRGGHGNDYFWHYSPWAATLLGPQGTIATHRNLRWRFTLSRRFDGGFVIQSPTGGVEELRNATATFILHYSAPFKQTLWTGKDVDESMAWTDREFQQLLTMAQGQFNDPQLLEQAGPRVNDRSTDEVFGFLDVFMPKARRIFATELGRRYRAGEKDILPRLAELLQSDNPRLRASACIGLREAGKDAALQYMSGVAKLLKDKQEFVRMQAVRTMVTASGANPQTQEALLRTTVVEDPRMSMSPNSLPSLAQSVLFGNETKLATSPFDAGFDEQLVRRTLEQLITLDPAGNRGLLGKVKNVWSKDTVVHVAGPLVFSAEEEQIADQMFSSRRANSIALLDRLGYQEAVDASLSYLRKFNALPRPLRLQVSYKRGVILPEIIMADPQAAADYVDDMRLWLLDKPLVGAGGWKERFPPEISLYDIIAKLDRVKTTELRPSLADEVDRLFRSELVEAAGAEQRLKICREELADPDRYNYFRKLSALRYLAEQLGSGAMADILPYLGHSHWRLSELAHELAVQHGDDASRAVLIKGFDQADVAQARAILSVLGESPSRVGRALIERAMTDDRPKVRGAAAEAMYAMVGEQALEPVLAAIKKATDADELAGYESAVVSLRDETAYANRVRPKLLAMLPEQDPLRRESVYWLIGQFGGDEGLAALQEAAAAAADDREFREIVTAVSYSPDTAADEVMLAIIKANRESKRANIAASQGIRRMVIGGQVLGQRPVKEQLDYAEAVLEMNLNRETLFYLGRIRTGRCAFILQRAMRRGAPQSAAQSIVLATSDLADAPEADRKLAVKALIDTIEFIEVTYLRGGAEEYMRGHPDRRRNYLKWKEIAANAGKNLLKLDQTDKAPLPEFDDFDLDM